MEKRCIHCFVQGRVQGVWYRASTQKFAQQHGLTGWVKNLADGRVELVACGDASALKKLEDWLWKGPVAAKVKNVEVTEESWTAFEDFATRSSS